MAGPLIGGRRPISWRLAIVVSFVAAYATARWLEGIFGVGSISGTVSFFVLVGLIAATWRINSRAANRQSELLGSARFGDRADVRKLEASGDLLIGRSAKSGKLLRYDGAAHLLTMAPTRSGKGVGTIIPNLLLLDRSVICIDPKGENARVTARARATKASPQGLFARQRFLGHKRNMGYATRFNRAIGSLSGWNSPAGSRLACSQR